LSLARTRIAFLGYAVEVADAHGRVVPLPQRREASEGAARALARGEDAFLAERADVILARATHVSPELLRLTKPGPWLRWAVAGFLVLAALLGFSIDRLGADPRVNILSVPLLGTLAWNAAVYVAELFRACRPGSVGELSGWSVLRRWIRERRPLAADGEAAACAGKFHEAWDLAVRPVEQARGRVVAHLGAAVFAAALAGGMYVDGIAREYRAVWESTFLGPEQVQAWVGTLLGPAAAVSGIPVPDVSGMRRSGGVGEGQLAAPWIHLYAVTLALFVVGPRLVLAGTWGLAASRRIRRVRLRDHARSYVERVVAEARGEGITVRAVAHAHEVAPEVAARIEDRLRDRLGGVPARLEWEEPIPVGGEAAFVEGFAGAPGHLVLVFNFSVTPEEEVHGELVSGLVAKLEGARTEVQVVLDASAFDAGRRGLPDFAARRAKREANWRRILGSEASSNHRGRVSLAVVSAP
jgi:hypothetical protein